VQGSIIKKLLLLVPLHTNDFLQLSISLRSVARGESFSLSFTQQGTWGYKNLNNEAHLGAIAVMPQ